MAVQTKREIDSETVLRAWADTKPSAELSLVNSTETKDSLRTTPFPGSWTFHDIDSETISMAKQAAELENENLNDWVNRVLRTVAQATLSAVR